MKTSLNYFVMLQIKTSKKCLSLKGEEKLYCKVFTTYIYNIVIDRTHKKTQHILSMNGILSFKNLTLLVMLTYRNVWNMFKNTNEIA